MLRVTRQQQPADGLSVALDDAVLGLRVDAPVMRLARRVLLRQEGLLHGRRPAGRGQLAGAPGRVEPQAEGRIRRVVAQAPGHGQSRGG